MKGHKLIYQLLIMVLFFSAANIFAQGKEHKMTTQEKAWMEYMTPGKMHKHFKDQVGNWSYVSKFWMTPNSKKPMVSNGTAKFETILGGRYLKFDHSGKMMGMPFKGFGLTGYDNAKKVYQSIWVDNMGTGIMYMTGNMKNGKIVLTGSAPDPVTGKDVTMKEINTEIDKNHFRMEMFVVTPKGEYKSLEIEYTRSK